MEYAYKHLSHSYMIQRDLLHIKCVMCITLGGAVYYFKTVNIQFGECHTQINMLGLQSFVLKLPVHGTQVPQKTWDFNVCYELYFIKDISWFTY